MISIKNKFTIVFAQIAFLISCENKPNKDNEISKKEIFSNSVEYLDIKNFEEISHLDTLNKELKVRLYQEFYPDSTVKMAIVSDDYGIKQYISTDTLSKISIYKTFYKNGKIKDKSLHNDLGFSIGNNYNFKEDGQIDSLNSDKEYPFTFEMLKQKLKKEKNIDVNKSKIIDDYFWRTYSIRIGKQNQMDENQNFTIPSWEVIYDNPKDSKSLIFLIYDAKNGKLLKQSVMKKEVEICGNDEYQ